ncbi:GNAT superfamily N-acetyltransferase [Paenibacillus shirakamiensis]|uniref:GNAT superfamily N-acetyltransferase n=1 Tax=Paenibacillus shirakamiensis TaxID=1265935 RepID=A0ABS4JCL9_9BACL|nr:GNAT family N-acetyltransferase [Paenibacillus shirakamiensis]MBP1999462.1 GNAT superfamily N-acetyltransferase [Paenibacillus shirakamiensis]
MTEAIDVLIIRDAEERDQPRIEALVVESYSQYEHGMEAERWKQYIDSIRDSVYKEGPTARIIAELNGDIVGSLLVFDSSDVAYGNPDLNIHSPIIRLLATSPRARGKGIATQLIQETARRALLTGAESIHLHTSDLMAPAIRLYEYLGFERVTDKEMQNGEVLVKCYRLDLNREQAWVTS